MITPAERAKLRELHAAATPGEWKKHRDFGDIHIVAADDTITVVTFSAAYEDPDHNAALITAMRNSLVPLLDALDEADNAESPPFTRRRLGVESDALRAQLAEAAAQRDDALIRAQRNAIACELLSAMERPISLSLEWERRLYEFDAMIAARKGKGRK